MSRLAGRALVPAALFAVSLAVGAQDSPGRTELQRADLSGAPGMEVILSTGEYAPGERIPAHFHHGVEAAYVLEGATIQAPGKPPRQLPTGTSLINERDVVHGGFRVVGEVPLKLLTVHVVDKHAPLYDIATEQ